MAKTIRIPNGGFESGNFPPWRDFGNVTISDGFPNTGQYSAFLLAPPFRTAALVQRIIISPPGPKGFYSLLFFIARGTFATSGKLVVSFASSTKPPLIIPFSNIPLVTAGYKPFSLRVHVSDLMSRNTEIRFEVNAGANTVSLELDDVSIITV